MSAERDVNRIVRSWLRTDEHDSADAILGIVLSRLDTTPQRRSWWPARRSTRMNPYAKIAIAAAAVLVVALVGYQFLPSKMGSGGRPTPAPSPTLATTPSAAVPTIPPAGPVTAGPYVLNGLNFVIDMPVGWATCCDGVITKNDFAGLLYAEMADVIVYADSCHWKTGGESEPRGAADIAAAFAAQVPRNASRPQTVTVGGWSFVHVRLTVPADQATDAAGFVGCDESNFATWGTPSDPGARYQQAPRQIDDLYLLDDGGQTYIFDVISGPDISASDKADLDAMLKSLRDSRGGAS